jgi:hypothetical protein
MFSLREKAGRKDHEKEDKRSKRESEGREGERKKNYQTKDVKTS